MSEERRIAKTVQAAALKIAQHATTPPKMVTTYTPPAEISRAIAAAQVTKAHVVIETAPQMYAETANFLRHLISCLQSCLQSRLLSQLQEWTQWP